MDYRQREDGLVDLGLSGLTGPDAQACLHNVRRHADPMTPDDPRSADRRLLDAARDLLLGRSPFVFGEHGLDPGHCAPGYDCRPGQVAPCGADVTVLVPLGAALGTTDELAELVGHGPLEPDLLADLLADLLGRSPQLRAVFVGPDGVPIADSPLVLRPPRHDPAALRTALLRLAHSPPGGHQPRHPDDHPPPGAGPPDRAHPTAPHPAGTPGRYRVPARMGSFLPARRSRCERPGCGARAIRCDLDHDLAWPDGPTCPCNLGTLCRRHHRIKQTGWTKQRAADSSLRWTSPSGRTWTSPTPHSPPQPAVRPLPPLPPPAGPLDQLSPLALEHELWARDPSSPIWDDPPAHELRAIDREPHDLGDPTPADTTWGTDLDDPYAWHDLPHPADD